MDYWPLSTQIRVPGKAMLVGEYTVLEGGPAVVAAITCYAKVELSTAQNGSSSAFVETVLALTKEALKRRGMPVPFITPYVDTREFFYDQQKLGLGSSAAVTVAIIATLFYKAGLSLSSTSVRSEIQHLALKAHQMAQGAVGSGADIVASTWGGLQVLNSLIQPNHRLPAQFRLVTTPTSASTPELIHRYRKAGERGHAASLQMFQAAEYFLTAWQQNRLDLLLFAVEVAFEAYGHLGKVLDYPLITDEHQLIHDLAQSVGGAAKPSGSGGGDIAVVFFPHADAEQQFQQLIPAPLRMLEFGIDLLGVHVMSE